MPTLLGTQMAHDVRVALFDELSDVERDLITEVSSVMTSVAGIADVCKWFAGQVKRLIDYDLAAIKVVDEVKVTMKLAYMCRSVGSLLCQGEAAPLGSTAAGLIAKGQRNLIAGDPGEDRQFSAAHRLLEEGLSSLTMVPPISKGTVPASFARASRLPDNCGHREQALGVTWGK